MIVASKDASEADATPWSRPHGTNEVVGAVPAVGAALVHDVLEAGYRIAVALSPEPFPPGVDTPEDLARAEARWAASQR